MKDYVQTQSDNGGVHTNSGIPNKAFHDYAVALGGNAWECAGRVWYETLRDPALGTDAQFVSFARITVSTAQRLYGTEGDEVTALQDAPVLRVAGFVYGAVTKQCGQESASSLPSSSTPTENLAACRTVQHRLLLTYGLGEDQLAVSYRDFGL